MKSKKILNKVEEFQYDHIYDIFKKYFKFEEAKFQYFIKDIIKVLIEFEKKGETIIDVDKVQINFDLFKEGWPDKHLKYLNQIVLNNSSKFPIFINNRKIGWSKWINKLDLVTNKLLNKINLEKKESLQKDLFDGEYIVDNIINIFKFSDLVLLEGGPGTGKTTLVINLILNLLKNNSYLNIGLSAPTGKATARLKETLNYRVEKQNINSGIIECQTLHSWIYNSNNMSGKLKLNLKDLDIMIIDECSMLSINILESVLELINRDCKLILVGDANQLPPINSCSIWNNIFENKKEVLFKPCIVNLKKIYRNNGKIQELSKLIFQDNKVLFNQKVNQIINSNSKTNVNIEISRNKNLPQKLIKEVISFTKNLKIKTLKLSSKKYIFDNNIDNLLDFEKELVMDIFSILNSQLILCPRNTGTWSIKDVNSIVLKEKEPYDFLKIDEGIPIMCTENNNELGISNGDIGVLIGRNKNRRFLFRKFNKNNEPVVALIQPHRLENIVPAIAITIHKSQGSESKKVMILWNKDNKYLDKEDFSFKDFVFFRDKYEKRLLYTAITRARENLDLFYLD
tara:strand:+ start:1063 stop:2769 length:1707 start_codon:yes stop_codon:yes gene_type:complete